MWHEHKWTEFSNKDLSMKNNEMIWPLMLKAATTCPLHFPSQNSIKNYGISNCSANNNKNIYGNLNE